MKVSAKAVNAGHAAHPRATNRRALNAVTAPKPMLLSAAPTPGTQTAAITFMSPVGTRAIDGTRSSRATGSSVAKGSSVVATATPAKP